MKNEFSKSKVKKEIALFFNNCRDKSSKEIKKIKNLAMRNRIPLRKNRKLFCKKCFSPYKNAKLKIKKKTKIIVCENCSFVSRYKIKN